MIDARTLIGEPCYYKNQIPIKVPTVRDVIGNRSYDTYISIFSFFQEEIWDMINEKEGKTMSGERDLNAPTPFQFFMLNCLDERFKSKAEDAFYFWTNSHVRIIVDTGIILFTEQLTTVKEAKDLVRIENDDDFFEFQNLICQVNGEKLHEKPDLEEDPYVSRIKAKGRYRDRIKKKKGKKGGIPFEQMLVAICCMGIGITPLNIGEIPYPAISSIFTMMQSKEKYETDIKIATAGFGNSKVKPVYWIQPSKK